MQKLCNVLPVEFLIFYIFFYQILQKFCNNFASNFAQNFARFLPKFFTFFYYEFSLEFEHFKLPTLISLSWHWPTVLFLKRWWIFLLESIAHAFYNSSLWHIDSILFLDPSQKYKFIEYSLVGNIRKVFFSKTYHVLFNSLPLLDFSYPKIKK